MSHLKIVEIEKEKENVTRNSKKSYSKELRKAGIIVRSGRPDFAIQNIVASVNLGEVSVDVEEAVYKLRKGVMYEPEQFPGAIYRMEDPKVVFLIFSKGKLVCVGAKREKDVYRAVERLVTILDENDVIIRMRG